MSKCIVCKFLVVLVTFLIWDKAYAGINNISTSTLDIAAPAFSFSEIDYDRSFYVEWGVESDCNESTGAGAQGSSYQLTKRNLISIKIQAQNGDIVFAEDVCDSKSRLVTNLTTGLYDVSLKYFHNTYEASCQQTNSNGESCEGSDITRVSDFSEPQQIFIPDIDFIESQNQTYGCRYSGSLSGDECKVVPQWNFGTELNSAKVIASYPSNSTSSAASISLNTAASTTTSSQQSGSDLFLKIARPANNYFVSLNKLNSISLNDDTLKILNSSALNTNLLSSEASQIVLDLSSATSNIRLSGKIQVIGKPADLIILTGSKDFLCSGCSFVGVPRVVIASAHVSSINYDQGLIKDFRTENGSIKVDDKGLEAAGVSFFDLVAKDIQIDGNMSLNVSVDNSGAEINKSPTGGKTAAAGSFRAYLGDFTYSYADGLIKSPAPKTVSRFYQGASSTITAGSVSVDSKAAYGSMITDGVISTKADLVMASFYQGNTVIPDQKISIIAVSDIHARGSLQSPGEVEIGSGSNIVFDIFDNQRYSIDAHSVILAAAERFANYASLMSKDVFVSANEIINEGEIEASNNLYMNGIAGIYNQFGGFIYGKTIDLDSADGFIVNGSLRPYKYGEDVGTGAGCAGLCKPAATFSSTYDDLSGTPSGLTPLLVSNVSATIIGDNIDIDTQRFQNVNPYYVLNNGQVVDPAALEIDSKLRDQVVISAAENLTIKASSHILNSSAIAEAVSGELALNSPVVTNERYRIAVGSKPGSLPDDFCKDNNTCVLTDNQTMSTTVSQQYVNYYAPAARFYSGGRAVINTSFSFINDLSYFEIHGDVDLFANHVLQLGLDLDHTAVTTVVTQHSRRYCKVKVLGKCVDRSTKYWQTSNETAQTLDRESIPSIFIVEGYLNGIGSEKFEVTTVISE